MLNLIQYVFCSLQKSSASFTKETRISTSLRKKSRDLRKLNGCLHARCTIMRFQGNSLYVPGRSIFCVGVHLDISRLCAGDFWSVDHANLLLFPTWTVGIHASLAGARRIRRNVRPARPAGPLELLSTRYYGRFPWRWTIRDLDGSWFDCGISRRFRIACCHACLGKRSGPFALFVYTAKINIPLINGT